MSLRPDLGDVLLAAAGGSEPFAAAGARAAERLRLPEARAWCVVVIDGLGWHNLTAYPEIAPFLTSVLADQTGSDASPDRLAATFPTSTATNLTYIGTGLEGGRTGMLGYTVRNPATGGLLNLISWKGGAEPEQWQREPTVFEQLGYAGRSGAHVGPWQFEDSGLTRAAFRGAAYHPAQKLSERVDACVALLRDPAVDVTYVYWSELDTIAHQRGWRSAEWAGQLRQVDTELERLARLLPVGTGMAVTADHGVIDVPHRDLAGTKGRIDAAAEPELRHDVDLIGGEPRFCHLYTHHPEQVAERWRRFLGAAAMVMTKSEAIEANFFGEVASHTRDIMGDVIVAAQGEVAILDSSQQSAASMQMTGMHGSTTATEQQVPFVVVWN